MGIADAGVLDHAAWASLTGPHAVFAEGTARARRYPTDITPFAALMPDPDAEAWSDLRDLIGPGGIARLPGVASAPDGWEVLQRGAGVQLIATDALQTRPAPGAVTLAASDVPDMLDLIARTKPGPFLPRTYLLGTYLGIRSEGSLIAMAGERMRPSGFTEISAVCTDPAFQRRGLAAQLVRAVAHGIRERGDTPFMHATATNVNAIRLYQAMGFALRREMVFSSLRAPA